jgi:POT family proton-dependent oligopeptide transporter
MKTAHPKGLYLLFSVEMWERFSFYGMLALLVLFMKKFFGWSTETAGSVYGWYIGLVFLTPILGGYLADRFFGANKCIIAGALTIAAGQFVLFSVPYTGSVMAFAVGVALLIIGNGLFKSNISVLVGTLYSKDDPRKDAGFTIFYMGINLGAALAPFVCGYLGEKVAWQWGFFAAGVGMIVGLFTFLWGKKKYLGQHGELPASPKSKKKCGF